MRKATLAAKKKYEGSFFPTSNGDSVEVMEYINNNNIFVRFIGTGGERWTTIRVVKRGIIRDYMSPSVCGVGILGGGFKNGEAYTRGYKLWVRMISRCYGEWNKKNTPTYEGVTVSENFKNYQFFKLWCNSQTGFDETGWELDKDVLSFGAKVYSENTCCFIPKEINSLLIYDRLNRNELPTGVHFCNTKKKYVAQMNKHCAVRFIGCFETSDDAALAYKECKEAHIKSIAEKWKEKIDRRVYESLINWEISLHG